jgi:hypothetical protein
LISWACERHAYQGDDLMSGPGYTAAAVRAMLREEAKYEGSQRALAKLIGCSATFLSDILCGKREPAGKVIAWLGLERHVTYRRKR